MQSGLDRLYKQKQTLGVRVAMLYLEETQEDDEFPEESPLFKVSLQIFFLFVYYKQIYIIIF